MAVRLNADTGRREEAFNRIFRDNFDKVVSYVYVYAKDVEISKNIAQEAFMILWENMDKVSEDKYLHYVYAAARNRIINQVRRNGVNNKYLEHHTRAMEKMVVEAVHQDGLQEIYAREIRDITRKSLSGMKDPVRETFELSRFGLKKNKEIARMQGISEKLVEYRITTALRILRKNLGKYLSLLLFPVFF